MLKNHSRRGVLQYAPAISIDFTIFITSIKTGKQKGG
jgi:hypothetical protein